MKSRHHDAGYITEHDPKSSKSHRREKHEDDDSLDKRADHKKIGPDSSHHRSNRHRLAETNDQEEKKGPENFAEGLKDIILDV
jgi:hypothetical protein